MFLGRDFRPPGHRLACFSRIGKRTFPSAPDVLARLWTLSALFVRISSLVVYVSGLDIVYFEGLTYSLSRSRYGHALCWRGFLSSLGMAESKGSVPCVGGGTC